MGSNFLLGVSLTASFLAGMLALFAPCCITFLFPSYLGTTFRENKKVMYYTLIFALGLAFILVPISLGIRFAIFFLDAYHQQVYYLGALILVIMGIITIKPVVRFPKLFHLSASLGKEVSTAGVFTLGLMSGLTSACCAPVLFAAVTLTSLSPTILTAAIVSSAYVLGIVMPLFVMSVFYEKLSEKIDDKRRLKISRLFKYIGGVIFILTGMLIAVFNYLGKIQMEQMAPYSLAVRLTIFSIAKYFSNPLVDFLTFGIIVMVFYKLLVHKSKF